VSEIGSLGLQKLAIATTPLPITIKKTQEIQSQKKNCLFQQ
jgi:hypothetical protein